MVDRGWPPCLFSVAYWAQAILWAAVLEQRNPVSRLEQATQRLQSAIDRLDRAITARVAQGDTGDAGLRAALNRSERQSAELQAVAAQAAKRLDSAIGRLRSVVEK